MDLKSRLIRGAAFGGSGLIWKLLLCLSASEIWPDKRGGFWWEVPFKRGTTVVKKNYIVCYIISNWHKCWTWCSISYWAMVRIDEIPMKLKFTSSGTPFIKIGGISIIFSVVYNYVTTILSSNTKYNSET